VWNAAKQPPRHSTRNRTSLTGIFLSSCGIIKEMVMPSVFLSQ
jgi:hypothetical protein